jgi:hypothetical protein
VAFALALSLAGGIAVFTSKANAAEAQPTNSVRCYMGAKHDSTTGWVCVPDARNTAAE